MSATASLSRAVAGVLVLGLFATSGCAWFRKTDRLYAGDAAARPLEVPPELDRASIGSTDASGGAVTASGRAAAASPVGFVVPGARDAVFDQVGAALAATPGVTIASRAQLLGAFDVNYEGSSFLVRVTAVESGVQVSAVDPRGLPAAGDAPRKLISALQGSVGR